MPQGFRRIVCTATEPPWEKPTRSTDGWSCWSGSQPRRASAARFATSEIVSPVPRRSRGNQAHPRPGGKRRPHGGDRVVLGHLWDEGGQVTLVAAEAVQHQQRTAAAVPRGPVPDDGVGIEPRCVHPPRLSTGGDALISAGRPGNGLRPRGPRPRRRASGRRTRRAARARARPPARAARAGSNTRAPADPARPERGC